jgi:hypothetical protein
MQVHTYVILLLCTVKHWNNKEYNVWNKNKIINLHFFVLFSYLFFLVFIYSGHYTTLKAYTEETNVSFFITTLVQTKWKNANLALQVIICDADTDLQVVLNVNLLHGHYYLWCSSIYCGHRSLVIMNYGAFEGSVICGHSSMVALSYYVIQRSIYGGHRSLVIIIYGSWLINLLWT